MRFYTDQLDGEQVSATTAMRRTRIIMPLDFLYDETNLYIITPYCDCGDLKNLLDLNRNGFPEEQGRELLSSILDGLEWLQKAGLTHKDIRPENIMINEGKTVIIDMGMCLRTPFLDNGKRCLINRRRRCGKETFMAPEVFVQQPFDGYAADMWAVGVCLYMMLTGKPPWQRPSRLDRIFWHITTGNLAQIMNLHQNLNLSPRAIDLLQRMLSFDPRDRLSLEQIRDHPWMIDGPETIYV